MSINIPQIPIAYGLYNALQGIGPLPIIATRNPTTSDKAVLGTVWANKTLNTAYVLTSVVNNLATWTSVSNTGATLASLTVTAGPTTLQYLTTGTIRADSNGVLSSLADGSNGQVMIGSGTGTPVWANITSTGNTIAVTNGANTINLEVKGNGVTWDATKIASFTAAVNHGYVLNSGHGAITVTMPTVAALGDTIDILLSSATLGDTYAITSGSNIQVPGKAASTTFTSANAGTLGAEYQGCQLVCVNATGPVFQVSYFSGSLS